MVFLDNSALPIVIFSMLDSINNYCFGRIIYFKVFYNFLSESRIIRSWRSFLRISIKNWSCWIWHCPLISVFTYLPYLIVEFFYPIYINEDQGWAIQSARSIVVIERPPPSTLRLPIDCNGLSKIVTSVLWQECAVGAISNRHCCGTNNSLLGSVVCLCQIRNA